ncbi:MAG: hypothetical protein IKE94_02340 [Aeriscardovia sp.]|nr:hypothetical protein [Aeriscardovia sp.]MBR3463048.1 hypothetical protein [Clostridiales bacterium]
MYCNSCGSLINEGSSFCDKCGAPVSGQASQPDVQQTVQPAAQVQQPVAQTMVQPVAQVQQPVDQVQQPVVQEQTPPIVQTPQPQKSVSPQPIGSTPVSVKSSTGIAITSFVLGMFTLTFAWIIFVNAVSVFTGLAGIILAIIWFAKKKRRLKPMVIIGIIASLVGMIYSILMWASFWSDAVYNFMEPLVKILY